MIHFISYCPGSSGDFLAYLLHKHPSFYIINNVKENNYNRYYFPDLAKPWLNYNFKISQKICNLNQKNIDLLNKVYKKNICLTTHFYGSFYNLKNIKFFRLYENKIKIVRLIYSLWWIKSHIFLETPIKEQYDDILKVKNLDLRYELLHRYQKWKYIAFKNNLLLNNKLDLFFYIKEKFKLLHTTLTLLITLLITQIYLLVIYFITKIVT